MIDDEMMMNDDGWDKHVSAHTHRRHCFWANSMFWVYVCVFCRQKKIHHTIAVFSIFCRTVGQTTSTDFVRRVLWETSSTNNSTHTYSTVHLLCSPESTVPYSIPPYYITKYVWVVFVDVCCRTLQYYRKLSCFSTVCLVLGVSSG